MQPTKKNKERRESQLHKDLDKRKHRTSSGRESRSRAPILDGLLREDSTSSGSAKSGRSQLVDLITEDYAAEETERVRARKEGGARWNENEQKHFVRNFEDEEQGLDIRHGFDPQEIAPASGSDFAIQDDDEEGDKSSDHDDHKDQDGGKASLKYGNDLDDRNVWNEA